MLKNTILQAAVKLAPRRGLYAMTRRDVAKAAGCGNGTINYHFESMESLREAVMSHAIENECLPLLALYVMVPKISRRLSPALKERVAAHIAGN